MKIKSFIVVMLFILISIAVYWFCIRLFAITNIVVVGKNIRVQIDESRMPKTLLLFPAGSIRGQILHENPILADIQFHYAYPHTLIIIPTLRTPIAYLSIVSRDVLLDKTSMVLGDRDASHSDLPDIRIPISVVRIGEALKDQRVNAAMSFLVGVHDILPIQTITVENESSLRAKSQNLDIVFPQDRSSDSLVATLQTLLSGFRIKGTLPTFIDLRFDKPIVKF